tara:strand:- start:109 stop:435 length:327 start_codon:yes stop_codon:yes gene_type:complete
LTGYPFDKIKIKLVIFIYLLSLLNPVMSDESREYLVIDMLVRSCYKDMKNCIPALFKINNYQKNAARKKKFSCQTRLLGLEANLIMAKNFNLKRKDAKNILDAIKKYC